MPCGQTEVLLTNEAQQRKCSPLTELSKRVYITKVKYDEATKIEDIIEQQEKCRDTHIQKEKSESTVIMQNCTCKEKNPQYLIYAWHHIQRQFKTNLLENLKL